MATIYTSPVEKRRMPTKHIWSFWLSFAIIFGAFNWTSDARAEDGLKLNHGDHICYIGNTMADRMQHHAWLETYLHALHPKSELTFRNLGFSGDEVKTRQRSASFGSPDEWLTKCAADVVFCFFGYNEALKGEGGLAGFAKDLGDMIDGMHGQKYNGESAPRLVVFSPIAHENLKSPHLPDGSANNKSLALYTDAMRRVCESKGVAFVDLFFKTQALYEKAKQPLTMNGIHLLDHGNYAVAREIIREWFGDSAFGQSDDQIKKLREAVLDKNYHWFSRYRVVDGYNVFGGRSKLAWDGKSNADVMRREMEVFDVMTANRDKGVWSVAKGGEYKVVDDNVPELLKVDANKQSISQRALGDYLDPDEAIDKMDIAEGMEVNVFASEKMFPRLINPVQMAVDTDSRLWASVWPSYPHWNPTKPRKDALVILPDENGDGVADDCIVFADELNSITGFEFWGGGVLVFAPPEIWFLKDTDGDDKADKKIRVLQGISSADTHHSANAVVIGPDGWLYWSRGIFNVAMFETPTKTFRTGASGVHRFNPRTFETEFHFPIGPNPHGDVIDQWGFQFANDGTSGTGSYVNIGKGVGNKKWFQKRVRPVPATGILSSSHFPEENNGNFLICNAIGFLGVLQHEVKYDGADITATEVEPIVVSKDPNFRPSDVEIGGDGALYISDWHNALIGHMQHNMRDPNRDDTHGRVYRVTYKGRDLVKPVKMKNKPIEEVCVNFFAKENSTRYRARLELSGRDTSEIVAKVGDYAAKLVPTNVTKERDQAQALLECLWVFEEHRVPNMDLLKKVFLADEPRVRAAAIRTLGHWAGKVSDWESTLITAARDESALVRAEAVKAAVDFEGLTSAEVIFEVATRPTNAELDVVLKYGQGKINVDAVVKDALAAGTKLSLAAQTYVLRNAKVADLLKMDRTEAVYRAILGRQNANVRQLSESLSGLAKMIKSPELDLLMGLIEEQNSSKEAGSLDGLAKLLIQQKPADLKRVRNDLKVLATKGKSAETRQLGFAAWVAADSSADDALALASGNKNSLRDFLESIPQIPSNEVRGGLFEKLRPLAFELPANLKSEEGGASIHENGIQVEYFQPHPPNATIEAFSKVKPKAVAVVPDIKMDVPILAKRDQFGLRFTGMISVDRPGKYTFYTRSDDGSRLYVGGESVVNNDGNHGMSEKSGSIELSSGSHPIVVTYFDSGGGDGLNVSWAGPGFKKQTIPASKLSVSGKDTLHDVAIRTIASIPGNETEKFTDFAKVIKSGKHVTSAVRAISQIPEDQWISEEIGPLAIGLASYVSEIPARYRTSKSALDAMHLGDKLAAKLPKELRRELRAKLADLKVNVIHIGTVPHRMIYNKERLAVQAGKPVEFVFTNTDNMPHNFAITQPGALEEVGLLAEATARDKDAIARHYIPKSDKIMLASKLLQPGQTQPLTFEAPTTPGIYPYVCTYPGHWRRMYGALYVVADLKKYLADTEAYLAANPLPLRDELLKYNERNTDWTFEDLADLVKPLPHGRSFDVGKNVFKVANCVACHKLNNEGQVFGPDLAKLDAKKFNAEHVLLTILEPSKEINEKFQTYTFLLDSGKIITGMIVKENPKTVEVIVDPIAKLPPTVLQKSEIETQKKSPNSIMPKGLMNKLSREEILDLVAYVFARGDKKNKLFVDHQH